MSQPATLELWGANKVAEVLGITRRSVWRAARWGQIPPPLHVEGGEWLCVWDAEHIRQYQRGEWP
jgi:predicted DNA-binding transcriptional regulator AlpA